VLSVLSKAYAPNRERGDQKFRKSYSGHPRWPLGDRLLTDLAGVNKENFDQDSGQESRYADKA
jgi:hypothetical protein